MYCPGLRGEGSGSLDRGRSGSGRLGRSNTGHSSWSPLSFQGFHEKTVLFRVRIVIGQSRLRYYFFRVEKITSSVEAIVQNKP